MFRTLRRAWADYVASIPKTEAVDSIPESQWHEAGALPGVSKARRQAFADLLAALHAHLPPDRAAAQVAAGTALLTRGDDLAGTFRAALAPDDETPGWVCVAIVCDWRAVDELRWQAERLCRQHGLADTWPAVGGTLEAALHDLGGWLQARGLHLLQGADGDTCVAFAVSGDRHATALKVLRRLKLPFTDVVAGADPPASGRRAQSADLPR